MKFIKFILPHLAIVMLIGLLTLVILDSRNPLMEFLTGNTSKIYIIILCILCIGLIAGGIRDNNK